MKRTHLGTAIGATAASVAVGMALAGPASAASPDPAPFCGGGAFTLSSSSPVAIPDNSPAGVPSTLSVGGQAGTVRDVDVVTNLTHTYNGEIQMELTHTPPGGAPKTVRFVTSIIPNRAGQQGFNGTRWDDSALGVVAEQDWQSFGPKLNLVPEGAMASFIGRNPNGTWTLRVSDNGAGDTGTLNSWTLDVKTSTQASGTAKQSFVGAGGVVGNAHAAGEALTRTIQVSGATSYLADLDLNTQLTHTVDPEELEIKLTSPSGTTAFISRRRGSGSLNSMTTKWDDSAGVLVATKGAFAPGTQELTMVPEGALGAFIGENPNGTWTLEVKDVVANDGFSLNGWSLDVTSQASCPPPPGAGGPGTTPGTVGLPRGPVCRKVNLVTTILGAKRGEQGEVARIKVKVANKTRNARARAAKAVFKLPAGFTLAGKQKGITLKRGKITAAFGIIAGGKAKTITIKLRAKENAALGLKTSSVAVTALCGSKAKAATIKLTVAPD